MVAEEEEEIEGTNKYILKAFPDQLYINQII